MMDKQYYIVVNDNRVGPLSFDQLRLQPLQPSTLVWTAGMADWARADSLPELEQLLMPPGLNDESAFGSYAQPEEPVKPWQNAGSGAYGDPNSNPFQKIGEKLGPPDGRGKLQVDTNWKTLAIVATVAGFLFSCIGGIIGIFAILEANKAENAANAGYDLQALSNWSNCKTLTIISFVVSGLGLLFNLYMLRALPLGFSMF